MKTMTEEKKQDQEKLKKIMDDNERLRKEKEELQSMSKAKPEEVLAKQTVNNQEVEKAKEFYKSKNEEIEELI